MPEPTKYLKFLNLLFTDENKYINVKEPLVSGGKNPLPTTIPRRSS
jgi:hypothetical protein